MPLSALTGITLPSFGSAFFSVSGVAKACELNPNGSLPVSSEGELTYTAVFDAFTPVAAPTDFVNLFWATGKVIRLVSVGLNVTTDSAVATALDIRLAKRSTAGTLNTAVLTGLTAAPHRSDSAAAVGVASTVGTANYQTLGTLVGYLRSRRIMPQLATYTATNFPGSNQIEWYFNNGGQSPTLLASNEQIGINASGGTLTGTCVFSGWVSWTESAA